jgi:hypothetical protein
MSVQDFYVFGLDVYERMRINVAFPNPPIDLSALKAALDRFASLIADATYGDSRVLVARDDLRAEINLMLRRLAQHVEDNCQDDPTKIPSTGFKQLPASRTRTELRATRITRVEHVNAGQLRVRYTAAGRPAKHYLVRKAPKGTPDPDSWPTETFPNAKDGALFDNLTPGVVYTFQVRVFGPEGYTDWSPAVDKMCM